MERGKKICNALKSIRSDIAEANDIDYTPAECNHEGDCAGTCPKCESEMRWLEQQLRLRQRLGKAVVIAGMSLSLGTLASCNIIGGQPNGYLDDNPPIDSSETLRGKMPARPEIEQEGDTARTDTLCEIEQLAGDVVMPVPEQKPTK